MPHSFDTGLSVPQRTLLRDAVVARLSPMLRANGLYLEALKPFPRLIRGTPGEEELAALAEEAHNKSPGIFVAIGARRYSPGGIVGPRDVHLSELDVHLYLASRNVRHGMARLAQDAGSTASNAKDPGIEVMMEHAYSLLTGHRVTDASKTVYQLIPQGEDEIDAGDDYTMWSQSYSVRVEANVKRYKTLSELMTELVATHVVFDAYTSRESPLVVLSWVAGTMTLTFTTDRPAGMSVGDRLYHVPAGVGTDSQVTIASLVSTNAVTLVSAPTTAPVATDLVYPTQNPIVTTRSTL